MKKDIKHNAMMKVLVDANSYIRVFGIVATEYSKNI